MNAAMNEATTSVPKAIASAIQTFTPLVMYVLVWACGAVRSGNGSSQRSPESNARRRVSRRRFWRTA